MDDNNKTYVDSNRQYRYVKTGPGSIVEAEYVHRKGNAEGNIFCEALPRLMNSKQRMNWFNRAVVPPDAKELSEMSKEEKLEDIERLNDLRVQLPHDEKIERYVNQALIESYTRRKLVESENASLEVKVNNKVIEQHDRMVAEMFANPVAGLSITGIGGSGKSDSLNRVLQEYPQVIIHDLGNGRRTVQVVYLIITLHVNANLSSVWTGFGIALDNALNQLNTCYGDILAKKSPGKQYPIVRNLIEKYHIGAIFIDEVELIPKQVANRGYSMQTFMTLANETGVVISAIGTREGFDRLFNDPHTARRFAKSVIAEKYTSSKIIFRYILKMFWSVQWVPVIGEMTDEEIDYIYSVTKGIIGFIKIFWANLQMNAILKDAREITFDDIKKAGEEMQGLINAINFNEVKTENTAFTQALDYMKETKISKSNLEMDVFNNKFRLQSQILLVIEAVRPDLNEMRIMDAFNEVYDDNDGTPMSLSKAIKLTMQKIREQQEGDYKETQTDDRNGLFTNEMICDSKKKEHDQNEIERLKKQLIK